MPTPSASFNLPLFDSSHLSPSDDESSSSTLQREPANTDDASCTQPPHSANLLIDLSSQESSEHSAHEPPAPSPGEKLSNLKRDSKKQFENVDEMVCVLSSSLKHLQVLMQRRSAEQAAESNEHSTASSASECPICREHLHVSFSAATRCGHIFHYACLQQLAEYRKPRGIACPVCRSNVTTGELVTLRTGLPEAPNTRDTIDLVEDYAKPGEGIDIEIMRTLKAFTTLTNQRNAFQTCVASLKKLQQQQISEIRQDFEDTKRQYTSKTKKLETERKMVQKTLSSISQREERLLESQKKYNSDLAACAKQRSDLKIREELLKAKHSEVDQKSGDLDEKLENLHEKEQRLKRLKDFLDRKRKQSEEMRIAESTTVTPKSTKRPKVNKNKAPVQSPSLDQNLFSSAIRLPSAVNRPPPPRRMLDRQRRPGGFNLTSFAPKRAGIQRPLGGVAQRK